MDKKCIIILDENLEKGFAANISSILGMSFGSAFPDLTGHAVKTADMTNVPGITRIPIPILKATKDELCNIFNSEFPVDYRVFFGKAAMSTKSYSDYETMISTLPDSAQEVCGALIYGDKRTVNKMSGSLSLYR